MEFLAGSEKRFSEFMGNLTEKDKIAILTHNDLDGLCSAVIASKVLGKIDYIHFASYNPGEFKDILEQIKKKKINKIFALDLVLDNIDVDIKDFEKISEIVAIDHHPMHKDLNSERIVFIKSDSKYPACYMCYYLFSKIQKIPSWIAALGIVADCPHKYQLDNSNNVFEDFNLERGDIDLSDIAFKAGLALIYFKGKEKKFYDILIKAKIPQDLEVLDKFSDKVKKEFDFLVEDFEKNREEHSDLMIYTLNPKYHISSSVINKISCKYPNRTIIFITIHENYIGIQSRRQDKKISMPELLKKSLQGIPESTSGGHVAAAGAGFPVKYLSKFKENLMSVHDEIKNAEGN